MSELASSNHKNNINNQDHEQQVVIMSQKKMNKRRHFAIAIGVILFLLIILVIVSIILALTLFKPKEPITNVVSASLEGISPKITFPSINIELNVTIDLKIKVENRNHARFKHGEGKSVLLYKGIEIGETEIYSGLIPSKGSVIIPTRLTLEADKLASNLTSFVGDLLGGKINLDTVTRIPGRVTFLGFIKKHIVAKSNCQFTIGIPQFKIQSQTCKTKI